MEPTGKIFPQPWMTAPETVAVFKALTANGAEARFVGGCVRDAVLKRDVKDVDIATPLPPETVMEMLQAADIRAIPTGIDHGTVTAVIGDKHFEITTLRVDVENYGRRAKVHFTDDWEEDAARRDFTINTLSCNLDGDVYDVFGGLDDLGAKRVRFVGIPIDRLDEDVLRLMRFFRFFAAYGKPPADPEALAACRVAAPRLAELSGERIRNELLRILLGPDSADTVQLMRGIGALDVILPQAGDVGRLRMMTWLETSAIKLAGVGPDWVRRLSALLDPATPADAVGEVAHRLHLSNAQRDQMVACVAREVPVASDLDDKTRRRTLYHHGADAVRDAVLMAWADQLAVAPRLPSEQTQGWIDLLQACDDWTPLNLPIQGRDVLGAGVPAGPRVGEILGAVEQWWIDGDFHADRAACLARVEALT